MAALTVQAPKPTILQPGEEEKQLVQGYRKEGENLDARLAPIRTQMGQLEGEMSGLTQNLPPAPKITPVQEFRPRQVDAGEMMTFAGVATALAALSSVVTRTGITGALTAAAGAIKGFNDGNIQQAKIDAENFQTQMRATIANNQQMMSEYQNVLADRKLTLAQKMQQYGILAHKFNDEIAMAAVRKGDIRFELERMDKVRNAQNQVEMMYARLEAQIAGQLARLEAGQNEPLVPVQNSDGTVTYVRRSQAEGRIVPPRNTGDKLTEAEAKGTLFWRQMSSAEGAARGLAGPTFDMANLGSQLGVRMAGSDLTNWLAPEKAQQYAQAAEQWAEAYLRLKTGAATTMDEIKRNARAYFPQPGDQPAVILQKNQMRAKAIEDVSIIAGRGTDKQPPGATPPAAGGGARFATEAEAAAAARAGRIRRGDRIIVNGVSGTWQ